MTTTTTESAAKKNTQKLQRAIVDGLEDVKAHDIQVFNTEKLSPLFERVIVASGTSNRQTRALAASVRDAVKEAGFSKPRVEGEDNGEWIIVDCGMAVVHIMQPAIRQYYHLEELWGETPVRLKLGAAKPAAPASKAPAKNAATSASPSLRRSSAAKTAIKAAEKAEKAEKERAAAARKKPASARKSAAGAPAKAAAKKAAPTAKRAAPKTPLVVVGKPPAKKAAAKKATRPKA